MCELQKVKNILITGKPGVGKTTLVKELIHHLKIEAGGFYTEEIRKRGERQGFKIVTLEGREGVLAFKGSSSPFRVGSYGVNLKDLEEIGVGALLKAVNKGMLVVIDEIGKMELFSFKFKEAVLAAFESSNKVLATVKLIPDRFTEKLFSYPETLIFELKPGGKEDLKKEIAFHWVEVFK